jgi:hypothetical protein
MAQKEDTSEQQKIGIFCGRLVYFCPFWFAVPRKIWQPWRGGRVRVSLNEFESTTKKKKKKSLWLHRPVPMDYWMVLLLRLVSGPGLPDFSCYNIPEREKIYQMTTIIAKCPLNIPNGRKIFLVARIYINIFHSEVLQNIPKLGFLV